MNTMKQKNPQSMGQAWSDDDARGLREIEPMRERGGEREAERERETGREREREREISIDRVDDN